MYKLSIISPILFLQVAVPAKRNPMYLPLAKMWVDQDVACNERPCITCKNFSITEMCQSCNREYEDLFKCYQLCRLVCGKYNEYNVPLEIVELIYMTACKINP